MASSSISGVAITNKTAFPLNIALHRISPFQHTNGLEPGDVWVTESPAYIPVPPSSAIGHYLGTLIPYISFIPVPLKWCCRLPFASTVRLEVRFDHGYNRFNASEALHNWVAFILRWLGLMSLASTVAILFIGYSVMLPRCLHIPIASWQFGIAGLVLMAFSFHEHRQARSELEPNQSPSRILAATLPIRSLQPPISNPPSPITAVGAMHNSFSFRTQRQLAVTWFQGRFALWDMDSDQEIPAVIDVRR